MNTAKIVRDLQLMSGWRLDLYYLCVVISWAYPRVIVASLTYIPGSSRVFLPKNTTFGPLSSYKDLWIDRDKFFDLKFMTGFVILLWI